MSSELRLAAAPDGISFWIHVTPGARRPGVGGTHGDALRVRVTAPPVEGKANAASVRAIADALGCSRSEVAIDPGSRSRRKRVRVDGDPEALRKALESLARSTRLG